jgi:hypothetical protein
MDTENCTNGRGRPRTELLPGHITYEGFGGSLPSIQSVFALISRIRFQAIIAGFCTADYGTASTNITGDARVEAGMGITGLSVVAGRNSISLHSGSGSCPASGNFAGSASVMVLNSTTRVSVSLI